MVSLRTARNNRVTLAALGLVLVVGGLFCIGQTRGLWFANSGHDPLLSGTETRWVQAHDWIWIVAAVAAGLLAIGCLRWIRAQTYRAALGTLRLEGDPTEGQTQIEASAFSDALERELESYEAVHSAVAELTGSPAALQLRLAVTVTDPSDLDDVRRRVESEAVVNLRTALEIDTLPTYLTLAVR